MFFGRMIALIGKPTQIEIPVRAALSAVPSADWLQRSALRDADAFVAVGNNTARFVVQACVDFTSHVEDIWITSQIHPSSVYQHIPTSNLQEPTSTNLQLYNFTTTSTFRTSNLQLPLVASPRKQQALFRPPPRA